MRRIPVLLPVLAVFLVGAFALGRLGAATGAQEGSPVVTQGSVGEGATYELIEFGTVDVLPPAPASIYFFRSRLEPGVGLPFVGAEGSDVAPHLVEAGTLTVRDFTADVVVHRAGGGQETVPAGGEASLGAGDSFVWEPYVGGEIANDGTEPVVFLNLNIVPVDAATPEAGGMAATPET